MYRNVYKQMKMCRNATDICRHDIDNVIELL